MSYQSFEELDVWKRACRLAVEVSQSIADCRLYAIRDQMQRAVISIPSNIAEGSERDSKQDFIRFLRIAKGSAAELRTQCYIAVRLELLGKPQADQFTKECKELSAMLQGLIRSLSNSKTAGLKPKRA
jgi:four helix bundle protein